MLEVIDDALEVGRVIAGKYRLERPIGEGGMGVVWSARELGTELSFALKFLREDRENDAKSRARFVREARAAMAVAHPNVAKVHAVLDTASGQPFLVMDLLEGESLRDLLDRRPILGVAECARILASVTSAIEAAHALGIVHRDLKPENVFLLANHDVRVLDFGIAKQLPVGDETLSATLTSTGALIGTPHYMAPEQIFGDDDLDGRADVWALGVVLYECLAGARPIEGMGLGPILRKITVEPIPPLREKRPTLPEDLTALVDRMLSRSRDARPALAEVRGVLDRAARAEQTLATSPAKPSTTGGIANRPEPPTRARRWPFVVAALASLGAAATLTATRIRRGDIPVMPSATASNTPPAIPDAAPPPVTSIARELGPPPKDASTTVTALATPSAAEQVLRARRALDDRDAAACLRACDAHDRLEPSVELHSTHAATSLAPTRAMCLMLSGDCEGGKALFRASRATRSVGATAAELDGATDVVAARMCTGSKLTPRDELARADDSVANARSGALRAKPAECLAWIGSVRKLAGTVPPRSPSDDIDHARMRLMKNGAACLARAGDCAASFRVFREEHLHTRPPSSDADARDRDIRDEYSALTTEIHVCEGKP